MAESATRRSEFIDKSSSKFWEMTVDGSSFTVRFGRIGTPGLTETKSFASADTARQEAEKLVRDTLKKGCNEARASGS